MRQSSVVSREEWIVARKALLLREKALTRMQDELSRERRELPWVEVERKYLFEGPDGRETLADLFGGRSQLLVYHFMFGPGWAEGCRSCSVLADHIDGSAVHLAARDITLLAVSRAPLAEILSFRRRMGWRFKWVSSEGCDFNRDFHVSFTPDEMAGGKACYNYQEHAFPSEEAPGISAFYREADGTVFHTYSTYARGAEPMMGIYGYLDLAPRGRNEAGLPWPMAWVRHHDRYEPTGHETADP